jgi:hypothetical protein
MNRTFKKLNHDELCVVGALLASMVGTTERIQSSRLQLLIQTTKELGIDPYESIAAAREGFDSRALLLEAASALPAAIRSDLRTLLERIATVDGAITEAERALLEDLDAAWARRGRKSPATDADSPQVVPKASEASPAEGPPWLQELLDLERKAGLLPRTKGAPLIPVVPTVEPVRLLIGRDFGDLTANVRSRYRRITDDLSREFGIKVPEVQLELSDDAPANSLILIVHDVPFLACDSAGHEAAAADIERELSGNLGLFLGYQQLGALVNAQAPGLAERLHTGDHFYRLAPLLRDLLMERLPLRPLDALVQAYLEGAERAEDQIALLGRLRRIPEVRAAIHHRLPRTPSLFEVGVAFEARVRSGSSRQRAAVYSAFDPKHAKQLQRAYEESTAGRRDVVVVVEDDELRVFVRCVITIFVTAPPVLTEDELPARLRSQARDRIEL